MAGAYGSLAVAGLAVAVGTGGLRPLVPLAVVAPFVLLFAAYDLRYESRRLLPELLAPVAIAAAAPSIVLAGGWSGAAAAGLWLLLALRSVPTVLYVRARLRLEKERPVDRRGAVGAHAAAMLGGAALAAARLGPVLPVAGLGLLFVRCVVGLSAWRRPARPKQVGLAEIGWGGVYVALLALGYRLGL